MLRKTAGRLQGWLSYTYSKARRRSDEINDGLWYRSPYDKPHNISLVATYELSPRWNIAANWVYSTGTPATFPSGRFQIENNYVPVYSGRNESRYPDYHRLDLSATWKISKPSKRFQSELELGLYNAYGRKNPWIINFKQDGDRMYAEQTYLFSVVPSVTWSFRF